ncbi:hypothetical protein [Agreia sp. COWG]|uniref:hypothetical protein n=1 Tax=Agreia sp. COWG TaxID=2773266 RepID=UPI001AF7BEE0|nr:hypothetical protein [Agreia sp. COWG]CAD5996209.1 conserved protein of unknown function [Agreia sp. COWG]
MIQLGTRWPVGDETPERLPQVVSDAVEEVEAALAEAKTDTSGWNWTLTWLEGKPVCELDDGTLVEYDADEDQAIVTPYDELD